MKRILLLFVILCTSLSAQAQEIEISGSRKAVRTSGDVLAFVTPVASLATVLALQDWQGLKQGALAGVTTVGLTYALKYIQAAMQAGVELGIRPADGMKMVAQSVKGAAELILNNDTHPALEIDKVCTPGGLTIKGINSLEHDGFTSAIINAIKSSAI